MQRWALLCALAVSACADDPPAEPGCCEYLGATYAEGATFGAGDGCNVCMCVDGEAQCTLIACSNCDGAEPAIDDCFTSRGYAECRSGASSSRSRAALA